MRIKIFLICFCSLCSYVGLLCQSTNVNNQASYFKNLILSNNEPQFINVFLNQISTYGGAHWVYPEAKTLRGSIIAEANLSPILFLFKGRDHWGKNWLNRFVVSFEPLLSLRMYRTLDDNPFTISSPVRPLNFNPGLSLYFFAKDGNTLNSSNTLYFLLEADHLSNGQQEPHFVEGNNINFISGDFSTNFIRISLSDNRYLGNQYRYLFSNTIGLRFEGEIKGTPFSIVEEQRNRIGDKRISLISQLRINNIPKFRRAERRNEIGAIVTKEKVNQQELFVFSRAKITADEDSKISRKHNFLFRSKIEHQLGNLERFNFYGENKYRTSLQLYFSYHQSHWHDARFYGSFYIGRDYLNIRYSDIINYFHVGFELPIQKFKSPKSYHDDELIFNANQSYLRLNGKKHKFISDGQIFYFNNEPYQFVLSKLEQIQFFTLDFYPCYVKDGIVIKDEVRFKKLFKKVKY